MKLLEKPKFDKQDRKKWSKIYMRLKRKSYLELDEAAKQLLRWHESYVSLLCEKRRILDENN